MSSSAGQDHKDFLDWVAKTQPSKDEVAKRVDQMNDAAQKGGKR